PGGGAARLDAGSAAARGAGRSGSGPGGGAGPSRTGRGRGESPDAETTPARRDLAVRTASLRVVPRPADEPEKPKAVRLLKPTLTPDPVVGGKPATGTVRLSRPASEPVTVSLHAGGDPHVRLEPARVEIRAAPDRAQLPAPPR